MKTHSNKEPLMVKGDLGYWIHYGREGNYFHWMCDSLGDVFYFTGAGPYIITPRALRFRHVKESIELFPKKQFVEFDCTAPLYAIDHYTRILRPTRRCGLVDPFIVRQWNSMAKGFGGGPKRILIQREKRGFVGAKELAANYDLTIVEPERLSVVEQMQVFAEAEVVVGVHGAGLTNLMFCQGKPKVMEVRSPNFYNVSYREISRILGFEFHGLEAVGIQPEGAKGTNDHSLVCPDLPF